MRPVVRLEAGIAQIREVGPGENADERAAHPADQRLAAVRGGAREAVGVAERQGGDCIAAPRQC
jgi:hypothetical protein